MSDAKILILTDGKAGHENQSKALVRALGCAADVVPVAGGYAAVVGTGSGTFYAAKTLARRLGVKVGVVLYPRGYDIGSFDCILAPTFDNPPARGNIVTIPANLVANDAAFYDKGVEAFRAHYARANARPLAEGDGVPAAAVIVGGPNKCAGGKTSVAGKIAAVSLAEFDTAHLLNLDITDDKRSYTFEITDISVGKDVVTVEVELVRQGAIAQTIYGSLRFYGAATLEAFKSSATLLGNAELSNEQFGEGETATATIQIDGETPPAFFKARIEVKSEK